MGKKQYGGRPGRTRKRRFYGKPAKKGPSVPAEQIFENSDATSSDSESDNDGSDSSPDVLSYVSEAESLSDCEDSTHGFRLVDLECLWSLLEKSVACKNCHKPVTFKEIKRWPGFYSCCTL